MNHPCAGKNACEGQGWVEIELGLSGASLATALVGYDVGVEIGQHGILLVLGPLVLWLRERTVGRRFVLPATGGGIATAGLNWFIIRAFAIG